MRVAAHPSAQRVEALYRRYGRTIYSRCRQLLRDDAAAEDATQEVFLRVLRNLAALDGRPECVYWIHRIATNYCLNAIRDARRREAPVEEIPEAEVESPEASLIDRQLIGSLLRRTPELLRLPARLYYLEEIDQGRIADALGISRRTVINRLNTFAIRSRKYLERTA